MKRFVSEVSEIVWQYKLSKDTINLAPRDGITEIQVFEITLKIQDLSKEFLPVALDLKSLYEQMMVLYIGLPISYRETLDQLVERAQLISKKERVLKILEVKMAKEKHFNRKVEINSQTRTLHSELKDLQQVRHFDKWFSRIYIIIGIWSICKNGNG